MRYDGSNGLHAREARARLERLIREGKVFDLTEKSPKRGLQANKYLHVCLAYFGCQTGETAEYVKRNYYKALCNPAIFVRERHDKYLGRVKYLRSSADLDAAEFALALDRFRNWAAREAGVYIPSPDEARLVQLMELEVERNNRHV